MAYILNTMALCINIYFGITTNNPLTPIHWICVGVSGAVLLYLLMHDWRKL